MQRDNISCGQSDGVPPPLLAPLANKGPGPRTPTGRPAPRALLLPSRRDAFAAAISRNGSWGGSLTVYVSIFRPCRRSAQQLEVVIMVVTSRCWRLKNWFSILRDQLSAAGSRDQYEGSMQHRDCRSRSRR
jgi:hypothetical protein